MEAFGPHDQDYNPWEDAKSKGVNVHCTYRQNYLGKTRHDKWFVSIYYNGRKDYVFDNLEDAADLFDSMD